MGEFVRSRRYEITGVYEQPFDEEESLRMNCEAYERKGRLEGLAEGLMEGMAEGRRLQNEEVVRRLASMGMAVEDVRRLVQKWVEAVGPHSGAISLKGHPKVITASRFTPQHDERRPGRHTLPDAR